MAIRTYKVTLDSKNYIAPEPVLLRQGDKTGAVVIDATLMDNGYPVSLSGLTPSFMANTADGKAVVSDTTGFTIVDSSGGEFTYQVPSQLGSVPGKIKIAYFSFTDASGNQSTFDIAFNVYPAADMTQDSAKDWISNLSEIINTITTLPVTGDRISAASLRIMGAENFIETPPDQKDDNTAINGASLSAPSGSYNYAISKNAYRASEFRTINEAGTQLILMAYLSDGSTSTINIQLQGSSMGSLYIFYQGTLSILGQSGVTMANGASAFKKDDYLTVISAINSQFLIYRNGNFWASVDFSNINQASRMTTHFGVFMADTKSDGEYADRLVFYQSDHDVPLTTLKKIQLGDVSSDNATLSVIQQSINIISNTATKFTTIDIAADPVNIRMDITTVSSSYMPYFVFAKKGNILKAVNLTNGSICEASDKDGLFNVIHAQNLNTFVEGDHFEETYRNGILTIFKNGSKWTAFDALKYSEYDERSVGIIINKAAVGRVVSNVIITNTGASTKPSEKKLGAFGDSITAGFNIQQPYHYWVGKIIKCDKVINYGVSGTRVAAPNLDSGESMVTRYKSIDPSLDAVVAMFGTNDFGVGAGVPLGAMGSTDITDFYGALDVLIQGLALQYVGKPLLVVTPLPRKGEMVKNAQGNVLQDYVDAIKKVCNKYAVACLDLHSSIGINPDLSDEIVQNWTRDGDGLHPNERYHQLLGQRIGKYMRLMI